tara:strand:- start:1699 stop:2745 length:1047 start_codon:yes stop_codon:yes gene_type:complete
MDIRKLMFKFLQRMEGGIFEKLGQIQSNEINLEQNITYEPSYKILPKILFDGNIESLKIEEKPVYKGTIGTIYSGYYNNKKILLKVVTHNTKQNVKRDLNSINFFGKIVSLILPHVSLMTTEICDKFVCETNIDREKQMCNLIHKKNYDSSSPMNKNIEFLIPVIELSHINGIFAYYYKEGVPIYNNIELKEDIGKRIALCFFKYIYESQIIFGDMNPGNILYDQKSDIISFIDYGCVFELNSNQIENIKCLHKAQRTKDSLWNYLKNWDAPRILSDTIYYKSRIFYEEKETKHNSTTFLDILNYTNIANTKLPNELIVTIRATYQLIELKQLLGLSFVISEYFEYIL